MKLDYLRDYVVLESFPFTVLLTNIKVFKIIQYKMFQCNTVLEKNTSHNVWFYYEDALNDVLAVIES